MCKEYELLQTRGTHLGSVPGERGEIDTYHTTNENITLRRGCIKKAREAFALYSYISRDSHGKKWSPNLSQYTFILFYLCMDGKLVELLTIPEFTPVFSGVRVTRCFVLCVCFVDRCLSFLVIVLSVLRYTDSDYPFGIFKLFFNIFHPFAIPIVHVIYSFVKISRERSG